MKYSEKFERDWDFYIDNLGHFSFWGGDELHTPEYAENGLTAKEYFYKLDTQGLKSVSKYSCQEPTIVKEVLKFKKGLNFHIKMWCEGFGDMGMGISMYLKDLKNYPDWVYQAFQNQLNKKPINSIWKDIYEEKQTKITLIDNIKYYIYRIKKWLKL